jgi:hypothetical protein
MKSENEREKYTLGGKAIGQQSARYVTDQGRARILLNERKGQEVSLVNTYARRLANQTQPLFKLERFAGGWAPKEVNDGVMFHVLRKIEFADIRDQFRHHRQSPFFEVIESELKNLEELHGKNFIDLLFERSNKVTAETNLEAVLYICRQLQTRLKDAKARQSNFVRAATKNYRSLIACLQAAMRKRVRMTIGRIDLSYAKGVSQIFAPEGAEDVISLKILQEHRDAFSAHLEETFKGALIDYTWIIEHGADRQWHLHCLILLDQAKHHQDVNIVRALGEHWKRAITKGLGHYWNCNAHKSLYTFPALGAVNVNDEVVRKGLRFIAAYFTLAGLFVKLDLPKGTRVLGGTVRNKTRETRVGRPSACNSIPLWQGFASARDCIRWM